MRDVDQNDMLGIDFFQLCCQQQLLGLEAAGTPCRITVFLLTDLVVVLVAPTDLQAGYGAKYVIGAQKNHQGLDTRRRRIATAPWQRALLAKRSRGIQ